MTATRTLAVAAAIAIAIAVLVQRHGAVTSDDPQTSGNSSTPPAHEAGAPIREGTVGATNMRRTDTASLPAGAIGEICTSGYTQTYDANGNATSTSCLDSAYTLYSTATLEAMSYGDAGAARELAYRLRHSDYPRALRLALRATALSGGDVGALIQASYWRPVQDDDGRPILAGLAQAYVLQTLAEKIRRGDDAHPVPYETTLRNVAEDPDAMLERLDSLVDRLFRDVREIQRDVTGETTIGGDGDA